MVAPTAKKGDVLQMSPEAHETHAALDGSDVFFLFVCFSFKYCNHPVKIVKQGVAPCNSSRVSWLNSFRSASVQLPG